MHRPSFAVPRISVALGRARVPEESTVVRDDGSHQQGAIEILLPRSQEVSGANRQAWQAAPCSEPSCGRVVLGAERVGGAQARIPPAPRSHAAQHLRPAQADQPAERAFAVGRRRVDQQPAIGPPLSPGGRA